MRRVGDGDAVLDGPVCGAAHEADARVTVEAKCVGYPQDVARHGTQINTLLSDRLPKLFCGYPTHFESTGEPGIGFMQLTDGPVRHRVAITDPAAWFIGRLGFDPIDGVSTADWLCAHTQRLAESTAGAVFHDGLGRLVPARADFGLVPA